MAFKIPTNFHPIAAWAVAVNTEGDKYAFDRRLYYLVQSTGHGNSCRRVMSLETIDAGHIQLTVGIFDRDLVTVWPDDQLYWTDPLEEVTFEEA